MRNIHILVWLVFIFAAGIGFVLSTPSQNLGNQEIRIGGAFALSGFAQEWGEIERNAAMLAVDEINQAGGINGEKLVLVVENTGTDNAKTATAIRKLLDIDKIKLFIGPTWVDSAAAALELTTRCRALYLTPDSLSSTIQSTTRYPCVFSTWYRADKEMDALARFWADLHVREVGLLSEQSPFAQTLRAVLAKSVQIAGGKVVFDENFLPDTSDFRTVLTKAQTLKIPLFFESNSEKSLVALLKQKRELAPEVQLYSTEYLEGFLGKPDLGPLLEGVRLIAPEVRTTDFQVRYRVRFKSEPIFSASNTYDAVHILAAALRSGANTPEAIRDHLNKNVFETTTFGKTGFDELGGIAGGNFVVKEIKNGEAVVTK